MDVIEYVPTHEQYAYTFGGVAPAMRVKPGAVLRLWSDDAFGGVLRSVDDLSSAKVDLRFVNRRQARSTSREPSPATPSHSIWSRWSRRATGRRRQPSRSSVG